MASITGAHRCCNVISNSAVTDIEFGTVDHIFVTIAHGSRLQTRNIGTGLGLGDTKGTNQLAFSGCLHILCLQFVGPTPLYDLGGKFRMRHDCHRNTN